MKGKDHVTAGDSIVCMIREHHRVFTHSPGLQMSSSRQPKRNLPGKQDLEAMSVFRYELRKFLRVSEEISNAAGITTLQYQLLL